MFYELITIALFLAFIFYGWMFFTSRAHLVNYDIKEHQHGFGLHCHYFTGLGVITNKYSFGEHYRDSVACPRMVQFSDSPNNKARIKLPR